MADTTDQPIDVSALGPQTTAEAPEAPQLPEGVDPEILNTALKAVAGIEDYTQLPTRLAEADKLKARLAEIESKYGQAQQDYQSLKAKAELSPYANPLVETVNKFFQEKRDPAEARQFLALHAIDVENMGGMDAWRQKVKMENPRYTDRMIDRIAEKEFGAEPAADDPDAEAKLQQRKLDIEIAGSQARDWLQSQMVSLDDPQKSAQLEAQRIQAEQFKSSWTNVARELAGAQEPLSFKIEDDKNVGGKYYFDYQPKLDAETKAGVEKALAEYAVANKLPLTQDSARQLKEYKQALMWNINREDFLAHMAKDMYASLLKAFTEQQAGVTPTNGSERQGARPEPQGSRFPPAPTSGKDRFI